jgi:hypothetical protein
MSRLIATVALLLAVGGVAACERSRPAPAVSTSSAPVSTPTVPVFTMKGAYTIPTPPGASTIANGAACRGTDYATAQEGTPVRVYDGQGKLLATGSLPEGKFVKTPIEDACTFAISVANVPDGPPMYSVAVGDHGGHPVNSAAAHSWVYINP